MTPLDQTADSLADFRLTDVSAALDAGDSLAVVYATDLDGLDRIVGDNVDMGAYEFGSVVPTLNGACCFDDGSCSVTTEAACGSLGGAYQGDNTVCSPNPCPEPTGACCYSDGTCAVDTETQCDTDGGVYQGNDVTCVQANCPGIGACCFDDGTCTVMLETTCDALLGQFQGVGTSCTPNPCPLPIGACCVADTLCYELTASECVDDSAGVYQGDGVVCVEDVTCLPIQGACCYLGFCQVMRETDCAIRGGSYQGNDTGCSPNPCTQPTGACCVAGNCSEITQAACLSAGGIWYGALAECADVTCPQPLGACCLAGVIPAGVCVVTTEASCDSAAGSWSSGTACADASCDQYGVVTGGTRVITGSTTWISALGAGFNHCGESTAHIGQVSGLGMGLIRFDISGSLPSNAIVTNARVEVKVNFTGGSPGDMEVYSLNVDPVICEANWNEYASGQSWNEAGGANIPHDRGLPAIGDQLAFGTQVGDTLVIAQGPLAREWVWSDLIPDGTATLWVSMETGVLYIDGDIGTEPPRLILTYSLLVNRRRTAVLHQMEK